MIKAFIFKIFKYFMFYLGGCFTLDWLVQVLGLCKGALGSGVTCVLPFLGGFVQFVEVSYFFWPLRVLLIAGAVWLWISLLTPPVKWLWKRLMLHTRFSKRS
jgi:hypothetical protein